MSAEDIKRLMVQVAALSQQLEQQGRDAVLQVAQAAQTLEAGARQAEGALVAVVRSEARHAFAQGAQQVADDFSACVQEAAREAARTAQALRAQRDRLLEGGRLWTSAALVALALGALLAAGGSSYIVWRDSRVLARIEYQQELQQLTEAGVLARCGKRLCARLGPTPERFDDDYVVLRQDAGRR